MRVIDLSRPLDETTGIFRESQYSDPPLEILPWADIPSNGYAVQALHLGTQTGTHLDMPGHMIAGGRTTARLDPHTLVGPAVVLDLSRAARVDDLSAWRAAATQPQVILLVRAHADGTHLTLTALKEMIAWRPKLIIIAGPLQVEVPSDEGRPAYPVLMALLSADIPVVEDVDEAQAARVRDGDWLVVAPLPVRGTSGAPCRVLGIQPDL